VRAAIRDLRGVGVDILTVGQYLRPSSRHLPVVRWWTPAELDEVGAFARALGFTHVEAGPLVRSSYHARRAVDAAAITSDAASPDSRHDERCSATSIVPKTRHPDQVRA